MVILNSKKDKWIISILFLLIIFGGILRFYNLGGQSLWIDEGFSAEAAIQIVETGEPRFFNEKIYKNHFFHSYFVAGSINLFGFNAENPWSGRLPATLFGIFLIPLAYILFYITTKNKTLSLITTGLITFSILEIGWSRQIRGYASEQFFILISLVFLWLYVEKDKMWQGILSILFLGIAILTHLLSAVFLPILLIYLIFLKILKKRKLGVKEVILSILFIPLILYVLDLSPPSFVTISYYAEYFFTYVPLLTILVLIGLVFAVLEKKQRDVMIFLILSTIIPLLAFMFTAPIAHTRYLIIILPFIFFFATYGIYKILEMSLQNTTNKNLVNILTPIILIVFLFSHLQFIPTTDYQLGYDSPQPNFKKAYSEISPKVNNDTILISAYPHLTKLYLGKVGRWIPFSISGDPREEKWVIVDGKDRVVGAPIIKDYDELEDILSSDNGFVIIDQLMLRRIPDISNFIKAHPSTELIHSNVEPNGQIWVFEFKN